MLAVATSSPTPFSGDRRELCYGRFGNISQGNVRRVLVRNAPSVQSEPQIHFVLPISEGKIWSLYLVNVTSPERTSFPRFLLSSTKPLPSYFREIPGINVSVDLCAFVSAGWRSLKRSLLFTEDTTGPPVCFLWSPFPSSFLIPLATAYQQLVYKSQPPP